MTPTGRRTDLAEIPNSVLTDDSLVPCEPSAAPVPARCRETPEEAARLALVAEGASIPLVHIGFGEVTGPPEPEAGPRHVVSRPVAGALPDRSDLLVPHDVVRDEAGRNTGCRALAVGASRRTAGEA